MIISGCASVSDGFFALNGFCHGGMQGGIANQLWWSPFLAASSHPSASEVPEADREVVRTEV